VRERKEWLFSHLERCLQDVFGLDRVVQDLEGDYPFLTDGLPYRVGVSDAGDLPM
jgi:hypothetical protein